MRVVIEKTFYPYTVLRRQLTECALAEYFNPYGFPEILDCMGLFALGCLWSNFLQTECIATSFSDFSQDGGGKGTSIFLKLPKHTYSTW